MAASMAKDDLTVRQVEGPQATVKLTVRTESFEVLAISWLNMSAAEWHQPKDSVGQGWSRDEIKPGARYSTGGRGTLQCDVEWVAHAPEEGDRS